MADSPFEKVMSSYFHLGNQAYTFASSVTSDDAHSFLRYFLLDMPVVPVLLAFHSLNAALNTHSIMRSTFWLKSLVVTAFAAFGGSTLATVLSGRPTPLFTVSSNFMMSYIFIAWYIVHKSSILRAFLNLRLCKAILAFGASAARMRAMFSFMDSYVREFPQAFLGAIICTGLTGSGGSLFVSVEKMIQHGSNTLSEFSAPGWGFKSAYFAASLYYLFIDPDDMLYNITGTTIEIDRATARFYISAAFSIHALLETLYGKHINPLFWLESIFYSFSGLSRDGGDDSHMMTASPTKPDARPYSSDDSGKSEDRPNITDSGLRRRRRKS